MNVQRVTLITLGVADLSAAKAFYARLGWHEHSGTEGVSFYQMHGCLLGLFGRADLGRAPVLLLDEVAAHLDIARRAALYDEICALGAQAIMTGTEAELFSALGDRGQVINVSDESGKSRIVG